MNVYVFVCICLYFFLNNTLNVSSRFFNICDMVTITLLMFLSNSTIYLSLCQLQLISVFLFIISYVFLIPCTHAVFFFFFFIGLLIWHQMFEFYVAWYWVFLYSWPLFWDMIKLAGNNLIFSRLYFMLF